MAIKKSLICLVVGRTPVKKTRQFLRLDGKTYERASNACVNFFLVRVKYVPNFTVFCRESEKCCNFALLFFWAFMTIYGTLGYYVALLWHFMALVGAFGLLHCFVENSLLSQFTHFFG